MIREIEWRFATTSVWLACWRGMVGEQVSARLFRQGLAQRHSREGGNLLCSRYCKCNMDSRLRGNDSYFNPSPRPCSPC